MIRKTAVCLVLFSIIAISSAFAVEFSADMITDMHSGGLTGKVYFKNNEVNRNEMMGMVTILKRSMVYQVFTKTKKYHVSNADELQEKNPMAGAKDFKTWAAQNNMKKVGEESFGGLKCDIYEGDITLDEKSGDSAQMKFWLSRKLNYPVKTETTMPPPVGKISTHLENIKIEKQPKHLFEIPAGYTEAATMNEAMGMPDMGRFMQGGKKNSDGPPSAGQMPSKEQMDEMMKKMQEMMKQN